MIRYATRRATASAVTLLVTSMVVFAALRVIPGDPSVDKARVPGITSEQLEAFRASLGLDQSLVQQYLTWLASALRGDFGESYFSGRTVVSLLGPRLAPTIELAFVSILLGVLIAVPLSMLAAAHPGSRLDRAVSGYASAGIAVPPFWLGVVLISIFAVQLGWLPARGYVSFADDPVGNLQHIALPAITMAVTISAPLLRFLRESLIEALRSDYARTAQGKGLTWPQVIVRHGLPNAALPALTYLGLVTGTMLGGVAIIEYVFGWPGLGALAVDSVLNRDFAVVQAIVLIAIVAFLTATFVVDVATYKLDPRIGAELQR